MLSRVEGKDHQAIFVNKETVFPGNIRTLDASPLIPSGFRKILLYFKLRGRAIGKNFLDL